jgi:glycine/D-amino acid oxidase-like deaminating enzyme
MRVVICGGGVIGASIAYFLSRRGVTPIVVERSGIACAASGKSGGFLALDWCDGTPLADLARRSFVLHEDLSKSIDRDWGYRRLATYGGTASARVGRALTVRAGDHPWLADAVTVTHRLGSPETTAQVHPGQFTSALMAAATSHGAQVRLGAVGDLVCENDEIKGVTVDGEVIAAEAVVVAMGPWSVLAAQWLPLPPVFGLKGHSLVFDTQSSVPAEALFLEYHEGGHGLQSPEVFPRADGTTYVCAISSEGPLPLDPGTVVPDPGAIERLEAICSRLSPVLAKAPILARQACFRPVTQDGLPLIGRVPGLKGAYVATGHSVWGILNAPATGEAVAELLVDGQTRTLDLSAFDPGRLPSLDPKRLKTHA